MAHPGMVLDVFTYSDYRRFLADAYAERHARDRRFSYRFIAQKAGFASAGFFTNVLKGKKDISLTLAMRLCDVFGLSPRQSQYFEQLVLFNKAQSETERQEHLKRLRAIRGRASKSTEAFQGEFYTRWQYPALREALALKPFRGDYRALGALLNPPMTAVDTRKAVDLLVQLGFLRKLPSGSLERVDPNVTAGETVSQALIAEFQFQTRELARRALEEFPPSQRNFSTLTLSISSTTYAAILEELRAFRRRVLTMAAESEGPDRVVQMNFQVFPMTSIEERL
jgi:uncharacterized protein (TIGR02147 family)